MAENKKTLKADNVYNLMTNLGINLEDKKTGNQYEKKQIDDSLLEAAYISSPTAAKFVDLLPEDMLREGYDITFEDPNIRDKVFEEIERLEVNTHLEKAMKWSRLYNGSAVFMMLDSNKNQSEQFDINTLRKIQFLHTLDRTKIRPDNNSKEKNILLKNYGHPNLYEIEGSEPRLKVDHTRLILFKGNDLPQQLNEDQDFWGLSPLSKFYQSCLNYDTVYSHTASIVEDFIKFVVKIDEYDELMHSDEGMQGLITKIRSIRRYSSQFNIIFSDTKDEIKLESTSVAGLKDLIESMKEKMVADSCMPHNIILGSQLGGGLNNDGGAEQSVWYDYVKKQQESYLKPKLRRLIDLILSQKKVFPNLNLEKTPYEIIFMPLWQMSQKQKAELHKSKADSDAIYIDRGVLAPEEVRESRFKDGEFNIETTLMETLPEDDIDVEEDPQEDPEEDDGEIDGEETT